MTMTPKPPLLEVQDLRVEFPTRRGTLRALDGVTLSINRGEILGVVGESGAGKSLTGAAIIGLLERPGRIAAGHIRFDGQRIDTLSQSAMRPIRGKQIGAIFQDPLTTLNPLYTVGRQLTETMQAHLPLSDREARTRAVRWLEDVGIPAAAQRLDAYPHQFSGGMRQRVVIALALCAEPRLVIADEPTTALDVTIQAQILSEMQSLCARFGTALVWITHDLSVIAGLADHIAVMYAGRIVEKGTVDQVLDAPMHPYTDGLIGSVPSRTPRGERLRGIPGLTPSVLNLPAGCAFRTRCARRTEVCDTDPPEIEVAQGHAHRCFHPISAAAA